MLRISEIRKEKGVSQKDLAKILNVSPGNLCEWEKGRIEPNIFTLNKLADFFGCSIDYLVGREDDFGNVQRSSTPGLTADEQQLLKNFALLGPFERETILIQINALAKEKGVIKK